MTKQHAIYVDHMGNDNSVVNAARLSFGKDAAEYTDTQNASLINFLAYGVSSKDIAKVIHSIMHGPEQEFSTAGELEDWAKDLYENLRTQDRHWTPFAHTAISMRMKAPIPIRTQC